MNFLKYFFKLFKTFDSSGVTTIVTSHPSVFGDALEIGSDVDYCHYRHHHHHLYVDHDDDRDAFVSYYYTFASVNVIVTLSVAAKNYEKSDFDGVASSYHYVFLCSCSGRVSCLVSGGGFLFAFLTS